jgi:dipeptidyl aminopeptidase/acylaminoacyl peptidase
MTQAGLKDMLVLLIIVFILGSSPLCATGAQHPLPTEELVSALRFADDSPSLSPDGQWLAYALQDPRKMDRSDYSEQPYGTDVNLTGRIPSDIWMTNTQSGTTRNLTEGEGVNWGPVWSPDGNYLAFYSRRSGRVNLWIYRMKSLAMHRVSDVDVAAFVRQLLRWTPDSKNLLVNIEVDKPNAKETTQARPASKDSFRPETKQPGSSATVYRSSSKRETSTEGNFFVLEDSVVKAERADLALVNVDTGTVKKIARGFSPDWYDISPDGLHVAFAARKGLRGGNRFENVFDLVLVSGEGETRVLASNIPRSGSNFSASWSPDGKMLSYVTLPDGECYVVPVSGGPPRKVTQENHPAFTDDAPTWDAEATDLYLLASSNALWRTSITGGSGNEVAHIPHRSILSVIGPATGGRFSTPGGDRSMIVCTLDELTQRSGFFRIDLKTGIPTGLQEEDKIYDANQVLYSRNTQSLIYEAQDAGHEPNFWILALGGTDFTKPRQLTNVNPGLAVYPMGKSKLIEWQSSDGQTLRGALLLPPEYKEGKRYPLIVSIYGGALGSECLNCFGLFEASYPPMNKQLFATRGYVVLYPDAPVRVGTQMRDLAKAVLPGINKVIEMGIGDGDKLGVIGQSYGGYSALALLVQTNRFKAGVMISGPGDLIGFSGEMDEDGATLGEVVEQGWWRGSMPGSLWRFRDAYIENSPIFYLDRIETPLLIVQGSSDRNAAPFLEDEVFVFLRRLAKEAVYVKYTGEGHQISHYANQIDYCNRTIAWFDEHLKGNPPATKSLLLPTSPE